MYQDNLDLFSDDALLDKSMLHDKEKKIISIKNSCYSENGTINKVQNAGEFSDVINEKQSSLAQ